MKILFITLSNIGDAVLTTPALSAILENFDDVQMTLIVSPRVADLFKGDPYFEKIIVYRKDMSIGKKMALIKSLRSAEFDLLVDFKDTMLPFFLYAKRKTPVFKKPPLYIRHMKDRHLWKLRQAVPKIANIEYKPKIWISEDISKDVASIFKSNNISESDKVVAVAPGARSHTKQWTKEGFAYVCKKLLDSKVKVILVGDAQDSDTSSQIAKEIKSGIVDLCGKTTLKELAAILKKSDLLITNDSAPMHIAWAVETPVVAIFGPTSHEKYRPSGPKDVVIRKQMDCSPCRKALCKTNNECMTELPQEEVFMAAKNILKI